MAAFSLANDEGPAQDVTVLDREKGTDTRRDTLRRQRMTGIIMRRETEDRERG